MKDTIYNFKTTAFLTSADSLRTLWLNALLLIKKTSGLIAQQLCSINSLENKHREHKVFHRVNKEKLKVITYSFKTTAFLTSADSLRTLRLNALLLINKTLGLITQQLCSINSLENKHREHKVFHRVNKEKLKVITYSFKTTAFLTSADSSRTLRLNGLLLINKALGLIAQQLCSIKSLENKHREHKVFHREHREKLKVKQ